MSGYYAVIDPASPRYPGWIEGLGVDWVPLLSPEPEPFDPDVGDRRACYRVDLDAMDPASLRRVCEETGEIHGLTAREALHVFRRDGMPVLADGRLVCRDPAEGRAILAREAWLSGPKGGGS